MPLRITTWNVNSVRLRLDQLARVAGETAADVLCLQEIKVRDEDFPHLAIAAMGFEHRAVHGMKGYNGVAILSRIPLKDTGVRHWLGKEDRRHIFAALGAGPFEGLEIHDLYVPAGGDKPDPAVNDKFAHKLQFLDAMVPWSREVLNRDQPAVLVGDLNVAPLVTDVWDHAKLKNVVTHTEAEVTRLERILATGWVDAVRTVIPPEDKVFTWWSYRGGGDWREADRGRRLDHVWVAPDLKGRITGVEILAGTRGWNRPSDHVPVTVALA